MCFPQFSKYQAFLPYQPFITSCTESSLPQNGLRSKLSSPNFKSMHSALTNYCTETQLHPTILNPLPLGLYIQMFGQVYLQPYMYEMSSTFFCSMGVEWGGCTAKRVHHGQREWRGLYSGQVNNHNLTMCSRWMCIPQHLKYQTFLLPLATIHNLLH